VLSPLPWAALTYLAIFAAAALVSLWRAADPAFSGVAVLLGLYTPMVGMGALAAWRKSSALMAAQAHSARQEQLLGLLLQDFEQQAGDALWEVSAQGQLRHRSDRLLALLAPATPDELAQPLLQVLQRHSRDGLTALRTALDAGHPFRDLVLAWGERPDGEPARHLSISGKRLLDDEGRTLGWRGVVADVSDKVTGERMLRKLAHTDALTGLANRVVLRDSLAQALRAGRSLALLSIDLDHFKAVNDSHGHSAGDELLRAVATRLLAAVRPDDLVARLGGDEFAVLVRDTDTLAGPEQLAQRIIAALCEPFDNGGRRLRIGASVGIALDDPSVLGVDDLLVRADMALYAAKSAGRGRHALYALALGEQSRRRSVLEDGLRQAIARQELHLVWQAKVDIAHWRVCGAEALMRWTHPTLGPVSPGEFIAVAEQCGLIDELGLWALNRACQTAVTDLNQLPIAVNVSPLQLQDGRFVGHVRQALRQSGLAPARLELEITESVFIGDADDALDRLHALRSLGVRVALDDFGTGYSSLSYLRRFPFDTLKIDRAFVNEVLLQEDARAIVQMMAALARRLGMQTVCEGVETAQQLQAVHAAGCEQMQGFLVSRPCGVAELQQLCREGQLPQPTELALALG
jgi:diguanylate cyclase (GGDEF)-like protein